MHRPAVILTVAGSDSGGGAGIQADLKTFTALGCHGVTALTALTAQNSMGVQGVHQVPPDFVAAQVESVMSDLRPAAAKTGMLASAPIIKAVARGLAPLEPHRLVVDPVMISTTGHSLIDENAAATLVEDLFPMAEVITPNLHEAAALLGRSLNSLDEMVTAAQELHAFGCRTVLLKGGHLEKEATDVFFDGSDIELLRGVRHDTSDTHGSGCVLAAAIAAFLGMGHGTREAVRRGKGFITAAIAASYRLGSGPGPVNPMAGTEGLRD